MTGGRGDSKHPPDTRGGASAARAQASAHGDGNHTGEEVECDAPAPDSLNRRSSERIDVTWLVDCETDDTFLYASITNISEMGIFVRTTQPLSIGTRLTLRFSPPGSDGSYVLEGTVQWINEVRPLHDNPNPGMGIRFADLTPDDRERIVDTIRTIAYLRDAPGRSN
ncbi:TIGR02266 family protein [Sorangium sp. So ce1036]|uniref:TIGR02266 family protein n=1 Tax=Sorangium sp. So ce1036 TaxID=3133328 RepID=UPI003F091E6C